MGVTPRKLQYIREAGNRNGLASREERTLGVAIQSKTKGIRGSVALIPFASMLIF